MKKNNKTLILLIAAMLDISLGIIGCSGGGGGGGTSSVQGENSVVATVQSSAPLSACPSGGLTVNAGIDTNGNGILDPSEVTSTQYVCNGANGTNGTNGANGLNALVAVTTEPSGTNCANGGKKVSVGPDTNGNGILDASEVTSTDYICNGASGTNGSNGTNGTNGSNGYNSLISIVSGNSPTICPYGGSIVLSGMDTNRNNVLDSSEVASTTYLCNGEPGLVGPAGPGVTWQYVTGTSVQAASNTGYMVDNISQVTVTLPASPAVGDIVQVTGLGAGGWKIAQNAGQSIIIKDLPGGDSLWIPRESNRNWYSVASSADGTKLVAVELGGRIYTSADSGATWIPHDSNRSWVGVASSADGTKLVAAVSSGQIYTSTDSGATWTPRDTNRTWSAVASSSDGTKLVAVVYNGQIYTSADSGTTWTPRDSNRSWYSVASSADGLNLVAVDNANGKIYTSTDYGVNWIARGANNNWYSVASSSDGTKLVAVAYGGQIYTSIDSGWNWTARDSNRYWTSVASSSDGTKLVAAAGGGTGGQLYTSADAGVTWTARGSNNVWYSVASSSDGTKLVAVASGSRIYTSTPRTTAGPLGSISGEQYDAIELQYIGNNTFTILSHEGYLTVQ